MRRYLYGISVRGASHIRKGTECQDSCRVESLSDSAAVIAAADGHGSESCPFSSIGAKIAVEVFCSSMKEILGSFEGSSYMLRSYLSREGNMKIPESIETEWKRRVMLDHIRNGREPLVSEPDADGANGVYKLYGTTLLGLLITTEFVFAFQIGDGDIVLTGRNGVQYAVGTAVIGVVARARSDMETEILQYLDSLLDHIPVAVGAHDHGNFLHRISLLSCPGLNQDEG